MWLTSDLKNFWSSLYSWSHFCSRSSFCSWSNFYVVVQLLLLVQFLLLVWLLLPVQLLLLVQLLVQLLFHLLEAGRPQTLRQQVNQLQLSLLRLLVVSLVQYQGFC